MRPYRRRVHYYETDQMSIVHHANYIRWMEEARVDFLEQAGFPYARMEAQGVFSPVKMISCQYLKSCSFGDEIAISVSVSSFNGVVLTVRYDMMNTENGDRICESVSEHVFLDREGHFVRLKRVMPAFDAAMRQMCSLPIEDGQKEQNLL